MEEIISSYARSMENDFVAIAGEESSFCVASAANGDYVESCDPPPSKYDSIWKDSVTTHDPNFQNPETETCTRFDKDDLNLFLPTADIKTGRKTACSEHPNCIWADEDGSSDYSNPATDMCSTDSVRFVPKWADIIKTKPNFGKCRCDYQSIVNGVLTKNNGITVPREPRSRKPNEFARHSDIVEKAAFLQNSKCTNAGESNCGVNKDYFGINLPDGKATSDIRVCGEIKATNNLMPSFQDNAEDYPDLKWNFMGMQESGLYRSWPLIYQCRTEAQCVGCSDPRYRSWYAEAASGPKDVVLVIDTSGSMQGLRMSKAIQAAKWVISTFSHYDYATVVAFDRDVESAADVLNGGTGKLEKMDDLGRARLKTFVDGLSANGETNMGGALKETFDILKESKRSSLSTSGCGLKNTLVLFLTDGVNSNTNPDEQPLQLLEEYNLSGDMQARMFTYTFGNGADGALMKSLACSSGGVSHVIPDSGDLKEVMASYFIFLAASHTKDDGSLKDVVVRWSDWFEDGQGLGQIASACAPVYDKSKTAETGVAILFGVICTAIHKHTWDSFPDAVAVWDEIQQADSTCPVVDLKSSQLEFLRGYMNSAEKCTEEEGLLSEDERNLAIGAAVGVFVLGLLCCFCYTQMCRSSPKTEGRTRTPYPSQMQMRQQQQPPQVQMQQQQFQQQQQQMYPVQPQVRSCFRAIAHNHTQSHQLTPTSYTPDTTHSTRRVQRCSQLHHRLTLLGFKTPPLNHAPPPVLLGARGVAAGFGRVRKLLIHCFLSTASYLLLLCTSTSAPCARAGEYQVQSKQMANGKWISCGRTVHIYSESPI
jgi:Mg-chelatase subunit ChlD